jgi:hypothetical protein
MKFNENELAFVATGPTPCDHHGFLWKRYVAYCFILLCHQ